MEELLEWPVECGPGKTRVAIWYRTSGVVARHGLDRGQVPASASSAVDLVVQDLPAQRTVLDAGNELVDRALRDLHTFDVSTARPHRIYVLQSETVTFRFVITSRGCSDFVVRQGIVGIGGCRPPKRLAACSSAVAEADI